MGQPCVALAQEVLSRVTLGSCVLVTWIPQAEEILAPWGRGGAEVNAEPGRGHNVYLFPTRYACHHG